MIANEPVRVAIVAALEREIAPLIKGWEQRTIRSHGRDLRVFVSPSAVALLGGIGSNAASNAVKALLEEFSTSILVSVGLAGALSPSLHVADLVLPERIIDAASGREYPATAFGLSLAGTLLSSSTVLNVQKKNQAAAQHHAIAVDMEAAAVAQVAASAGVPFLAVKAISDEAGFEMPPFHKFIQPDGSFSTASFLAYAALRPQSWPRILRLSRNSRRASEALCDRLRHLIDNRELATSAIKLNKA